MQRCSYDFYNSNLASEYVGTYRTLELWRKPIDKPYQMAAIKHGGMKGNKSNHVGTSFELMV